MNAERRRDAAFRTGSQLLGQSAVGRFTITGKMVSAFAALSGDRSPIHVDDDFARASGYDGRLAHGALLAALTSSVVGMDLPGKGWVLQEIAFRFRRPVYLGDALEVRVEAREYFDSVGVLQLAVKIRNQHGELAATGMLQSGMAVP